MGNHSFFCWPNCGERRIRRRSPYILVVFSDEGTFAVVEADHYRCPPAKVAWPELRPNYAAVLRLAGSSHSLLVLQHHDADSKQTGAGVDTQYRRNLAFRVDFCPSNQILQLLFHKQHLFIVIAMANR